MTDSISALLCNSGKLLKSELKKMSMLNIAKKYGLSYYRIRNMCHELGISRSKKEAHQWLKKLDPEKYRRDRIPSEAKKIAMSKGMLNYWDSEDRTEEIAANRKRVIGLDRSKIDYKNRKQPQYLRRFIKQALEEHGYIVELETPDLNKKFKTHVYALFLPEINVVIDIFGYKYWCRSSKRKDQYKYARKMACKIVNQGFIYIRICIFRVNQSDGLLASVKEDLIFFLRNLENNNLRIPNPIIDLVYHNRRFRRAINKEIEAEFTERNGEQFDGN